MVIEQIEEKLIQIEEKWELNKKEESDLCDLFRHSYESLNDIEIQMDYLTCKLNHGFYFNLDVYDLEEDIKDIRLKLRDIDNAILLVCSIIFEEKDLSFWGEEERNFIFSLYWFEGTDKQNLANLIIEMKPFILSYKYDEPEKLILILNTPLNITITFDLSIDTVNNLSKQVKNCKIFNTCLKNYLMTSKLLN